MDLTPIPRPEYWTSLPQWMLDKPEPDELDDGAFSKASQDQFDKALLGHLDAMIEPYQLPPDHPIGTDPNNKWRTISSMQKGVRFGFPADASFAASAAFDMDKAHAFRRIGVIAIEDCLMGAPLLSAACLAVLGHAAWRKSVGERRLLCFLAEALAQGHKDRMACNLTVAAMREELVPRADWALAGDDRLMATAWNQEFTYGQRMCALWLLAGTKRFPGRGFPENNERDPKAIHRFMVDLGMPRLFLYLAARTASRLGEVMFATMPLIWQAAFSDAPLHLWSRPGYPERVGLLLGAGYDRHTREGKAAILKFARNHPSMEKFRNAVPKKDFDELFFTGVFHGEGGVLDHAILYGAEGPDLIWSISGPARFRKWLGPLADEFLPAIRENLPALNEVRRHVLWQK